MLICKTINQKNWAAYFWAITREFLSSMECVGQLEEFS